MTQTGFHWLLALVAFASCTDATAQIYSCRAPDGTRIFSNERCGPDAKVVPGIGGAKRPAAKAQGSTQPPAIRKSAAELEALLKECDDGKVAACNAWTRGGGPNQLREQERKAQAECEAGSLKACEERYCADGASSQCRAQVLQAAGLAGETWYVRDGIGKTPEGASRYTVRCIWEGVRTTRDVNVVCARQAGPRRCSDAGSDQAFAQLAAAAASYCARR